MIQPIELCRDKRKCPLTVAYDEDFNDLFIHPWELHNNSVNNCKVLPWVLEEVTSLISSRYSG
jgi:hypothetical protein